MEKTDSVRSMGISWGYQRPQVRPEFRLSDLGIGWPTEADEIVAKSEAGAEDGASAETVAEEDVGLLWAPEDACCLLHSEGGLMTFAGRMAVTSSFMLFTERLQVMKNGEVCGTVTLSAEKMTVIPNAHLTYSCHITAPDYSVMALVSETTLETQVERRSGPGGASTFLHKDEEALHVSVRGSKDAEPERWDLPEEISSRLLCEGSSLLLIRHMGVARFKGSLSFLGLLDGGGGLALVTLTSTFGSYEDTTAVMRAVRPLRRGLPTCLVECEVTRAGELLWMARTPGEWWVRADPRNRLCGTMRLGKLLPPLARRWEEDPQLWSMYLDRVQAQRARYRQRMPELQPLLGDFLCSLLIAKPTNAFAFAVDYFTAQAGTSPEDDPEQKADDEERTTVGLQYPDALFYYEMEIKKQVEARRKKQEEMSVGDECEKEPEEEKMKDGGSEQSVSSEERERERTMDYTAAKNLLTAELSTMIPGVEEEKEEETREREWLFREAGLADMLVSELASAAVEGVEAERLRRRICTSKLPPVLIQRRQGPIQVYHDERYGDHFWEADPHDF